MKSTERRQLFEQIMWDYSIPVEDIEAVFEGKRTHAGHYTKETLFVKLLESYSWFTILQLLPINQIQDLLSTDTINKIRSKSLQKKYEFVQQRLREIIPTTG